MSGSMVAIVPIRAWVNGKTRLAPILSPGAREALIRRSAVGVVRAAVASEAAATVVVVSPDPRVLEWAETFGSPVEGMRQPESMPGLNGAIEAGRAWARERGANRILSLFADLPLLTADDVREIASRPEAVVLGPDRNGTGTNALLLRVDGPGAAFRFAFGEGSLAKHVAEAERLELESAIYESTGTGFDLDTPGDWVDFLEVVSSGDVEDEVWPTPDGVCAR